MIAGIEEASDGRIRIGERIVNHLPPQGPRHFHGLPELRALPHMTGYDDMAFGLKLRHTAKAEIARRVNAAAQDSGHG